MAKPTIIVKSFEYKIRATRIFEEAAQKALDDSRFVWNCALEQRIMLYRQHGIHVGLYDQSKQLTEARRDILEVGDCIRAIQQDVLEKIELAFQAFFRRIKSGEKPGFPRFKSAARYRTFTQKYDRGRACPLVGDVVYIPSVGRVRVRLSRPIEGKVKLIQVTHRSDGWYVTLVCDVLRPVTPPLTGQSVGVDVGLTHFATLSTGEQIANPRHVKKELKKIRRTSRAINRRKKGSENRKKSRKRMSEIMLTLTRRRGDFHHKVALDLVRRFDVIAVEDLKIQSMIDSPNYKASIADVGWGIFFRTLERKAEKAGRIFVRKEPAYTSQTCSNCGARKQIPKGPYTYRCPCGLTLDRDWNAAINILRAGSPKVTPAEFLKRGPRKQERGASPEANVVTGNPSLDSAGTTGVTN